MWEQPSTRACALHRLSLNLYEPIASVAALSERPAGWQQSRHKLIGAMPPRFVIARSEATWQSHATGYVFAEGPVLSSRVPRDCHVGLRPPRNDNSEAIAIFKEALIKSTRMEIERFFVKSRFGKRRNTLCISSFSNRRIGKKDPMSADGDLFRGSLILNVKPAGKAAPCHPKNQRLH